MMYAYFSDMPVINESYTCCSQFADKFKKMTGQQYLKNDKDIYKKLVKYGDEKSAFSIAEHYYTKCKRDEKKNYQKCDLQALYISL